MIKRNMSKTIWTQNQTSSNLNLEISSLQMPEQEYILGLFKCQQLFNICYSYWNTFNYIKMIYKTMFIIHTHWRQTVWLNFATGTFITGMSSKKTLLLIFLFAYQEVGHKIILWFNAAKLEFSRKGSKLLPKSEGSATKDHQTNKQMPTMQ